MKINFNFVPFPLEIWQDGIQISLGEFRLLGYLLHWQLRFGKLQHIRLTDDEILHGVRGNGGTRRDAGCGLSLNAIKAARAALMARGWIALEEDLSDKARPKRWYTVCLQENELELSNFDSRVSENDRSGIKN